MKKLWKRYREEAAFLPLAILALLYNHSSQEPRELDAFDQIVLTLRLAVIRLSSRDKYIDYNSEELYNPGKKGALAWWCQDTQRQHWPRLSLMAIDILSIPPMSNEPERVFSGACCTVSWDRGQLEPETIEMRECLKHWKRSGILDTFFETS